MKKIISVLLALFLISLLSSCKKESLPLPETDSGIRKDLGVDKNINEKTIDNYLNREDTVYIDLRMLKDEANYEAIGGDSHLSGFIKGFKVIPYPYLCNPTDLPEEVGEGYKGFALYTKNEDGTYSKNYKEADSIINNLFPKDKYIFLMCGGGGYAGKAKELLVSLGYDENKIYNVGGYWYYEGNNKVEVKKEVNGKTEYDFSIVDYEEINFVNLTAIDGYKPHSNKKESVTTNDLDVIDLFSYQEIKELQDRKETFLLYIYLTGCPTCKEFQPIVKEFVETNDVRLYEISYNMLENDENIIREKIEYAPSIFIFVDGEIKAFLNPKSDEDYDKYKTLENLTKWISEYIDIDIVKTKRENNSEECGTACKL